MRLTGLSDSVNLNMPMDDLSLVKGELEKLDFKALQRLEVETDVPATTAAKIRSGETKNPRYKTVRALANYFHAKAQKDRRETDRIAADPHTS